jgi:hypothetical protein
MAQHVKFALLAICAGAAVFPPATDALENGVARTPPRGWLSWWVIG